MYNYSDPEENKVVVNVPLNGHKIYHHCDGEVIEYHGIQILNIYLNEDDEVIHLDILVKEVHGYGMKVITDRPRYIEMRYYDDIDKLPKGTYSISDLELSKEEYVELCINMAGLRITLNSSPVLEDIDDIIEGNEPNKFLITDILDIFYTSQTTPYKPLSGDSKRSVILKNENNDLHYVAYTDILESVHSMICLHDKQVL